MDHTGLYRISTVYSVPMYADIMFVQNRTRNHAIANPYNQLHDCKLNTIS